MVSITFRSRVEFENLEVQNRLKTAPFHGYMFASPRIVVRVDFHLRIYRDSRECYHRGATVSCFTRVPPSSFPPRISAARAINPPRGNYSLSPRIYSTRLKFKSTNKRTKLRPLLSLCIQLTPFLIF